MSAFLLAHGGQVVLATLFALIVLVIVLIVIARHLEQRLQHVEHELADLRHDLDLPATTPEVTKRFDVLRQQREFA